eukprot:scaffold28802_cov27-Tisochrysis_lutea.AAC.1
MSRCSHGRDTKRGRAGHRGEEQQSAEHRAMRVKRGGRGSEPTAGEEARARSRPERASAASTHRETSRTVLLLLSPPRKQNTKHVCRMSYVQVGGKKKVEREVKSNVLAG